MENAPAPTRPPVPAPIPTAAAAPVLGVVSPVAPYYPPPLHQPPGWYVPVDGKATAAMALAIVGIVFGLPFGLPGMVLGPIAYFMGRSAQARIDASGATIGGRGQAQAGWILGAVATGIGCVASLIYLVVLLMAISVPTV